RTLGNIIWSCLSTIFLCTWVAIHPNIHFRPEKRNQSWAEKCLWEPLYEVVTYKLPLFLCALLFPEFILSWAVRQWFAAGKISDKVDGWTRTHGFFMLMGGFHLFRLSEDSPSIQLPLKSANLSQFVMPSGGYSQIDAEPECPLKFEDFPVEVLEFITPTEAELKDRGKSDSLTKIIVLIQTVWFVVQCIARGKQQLPLTELEVVTLAHTILNFFIYLSWWNKPKNVECPIRIYKPFAANHEESGEEADELDEEWVDGWLRKRVGYIVGEKDVCVTLSDKRSIPMFWSGRSYRDGVFGPYPTVPASVLGAIFVDIHIFIAGPSDFPSHAEFVLWRVSCAAMLTFPFIVFMLAIYVGLHDATKKYSLDWLWVPLGAISFVLLLPSSLLYIAGRITTLVIAFTTLRSLPPDAFATVNWTTFIPHI
ncbi:hypothetical protein M408DRAFT_39731, partial [Serendipita vermifera MAFF 305830]